MRQEQPYLFPGRMRPRNLLCLNLAIKEEGLSKQVSQLYPGSGKGRLNGVLRIAGFRKFKTNMNNSLTKKRREGESQTTWTEKPTKGDNKGNRENIL